MKENVSDIVDILREAYHNEAVWKKEAEELKVENEALRAEIASLKERLLHYERPRLDSHNSHTPPAQESLKAQGIRRTRSLRKPSGKKTGGQVGHKGHTLIRSEEVDEIRTHSPGRCAHCGKSLETVEGVPYETRQSIDVPFPIRPLVTDHVAMKKKCSCGYCTRADFPSYVKPGVSYGVNVHALVAYLSTAQHIPFKRLTEVLHDFYGLKMSQGSVSNILRRMRKQGFVRYNEIKREIQSSPVVGADETGMYKDKKLYWMWVFQNQLATFVFPDAFRAKGAIERQFPTGLPDSILVTDRLSSYFKVDVDGHQICLAHLLRDLVYLTELSPEQDWSVRMLKVLQDSIRQRESDDVHGNNLEEIRERFQTLIEEDISHLRYEFRRFQKGLSRCSDNLFLFLENPEIPPDNNASERAIRPLKVKQKVSGQFKSDEGMEAFAVIHSIVDTAKKKKQDPFLELIDIAKLVINYQS